MAQNPTDEQLFAQISDHAQTLSYLLQYAIHHAPQGAQTSAYLLKVAKRHLTEMLSFSRSGLGIELSPEQVAMLERDPDYILAQQASRPVAALTA